MKNHRLALPGRFLAMSLLLSAGCSREKSVTTTSIAPKPSPAPAAAPASLSAPAGKPTEEADPTVAVKAALERATLEEPGELAALQQRLDQQMDAAVAAKKTAADVSLAADQKLDTASANFAEKIRMLSVARPETWTSAKDQALQALQQVESAYSEVMKSPARP